MRSLYHFPLCPFSRKVRLVLAEKGLEYQLVNENFWERRRAFAKLNPAMQVPVLVEDSGSVFPDSYSICEYIDAKYPQRKLLGNSLEESAEIRRLVSWFDNKFYQEVGYYLVNEKVVRFLTRVGEPHTEAIRAAKANIVPHMEYLKYLSSGSKWLLGDDITLADITAAAHLSVVDYLGEVPWHNYPEVKEWYALIKSRPSFRSLLSDRVTGYAPPKCYADLDF